LVLPITLGVALGLWVSPLLPQFAARVHALGVWAPVAFVVAYVAVVVLMMPAFLMIIAGGAVFGTAYGSALAMTGSVLGGSVAFLIARHLAREPVAKRVARNPKLAIIDRSIGREGARIVFLLRLSPAVPFVLSNYALGITQVRYSHFVMGTLGLVPMVLAFAAYGNAAGATTINGKAQTPPWMLGVGLVATILLGVVLGRIAQRALRAESTRNNQQDG
jgi:uncharacterized membrane protein YdjX (TVP38/TMEM64 family)